MVPASSRLDGSDARLAAVSTENAIAISPDGRFAVVTTWAANTIWADPQQPGQYVARNRNLADPSRDAIKLKNLISRGEVATLEVPDLGRWRDQGVGFFRFTRGTN